MTQLAELIVTANKLPTDKETDIERMRDRIVTLYWGPWGTISSEERRNKERKVNHVIIMSLLCIVYFVLRGLRGGTVTGVTGLGAV